MQVRLYKAKNNVYYISITMDGVEIIVDKNGNPTNPSKGLKDLEPINTEKTKNNLFEEKETDIRKKIPSNLNSKTKEARAGFIRHELENHVKQILKIVRDLDFLAKQFPKNLSIHHMRTAVLNSAKQSMPYLDFSYSKNEQPSKLKTLDETNALKTTLSLLDEFHAIHPIMNFDKLKQEVQNGLKSQQSWGSWLWENAGYGVKVVVGGAAIVGTGYLLSQIVPGTNASPTNTLQLSYPNSSLTTQPQCLPGEWNTTVNGVTPIPQDYFNSLGIENFSDTDLENSLYQDPNENSLFANLLVKQPNPPQEIKSELNLQATEALPQLFEETPANQVAIYQQPEPASNPSLTPTQLENIAKPSNPLPTNLLSENNQASNEVSTLFAHGQTPAHFDQQPPNSQTSAALVNVPQKAPDPLPKFEPESWITKPLPEKTEEKNWPSIIDYSGPDNTTPVPYDLPLATPPIQTTVHVELNSDTSNSVATYQAPKQNLVPELTSEQLEEVANLSKLTQQQTISENLEEQQQLPVVNAPQTGISDSTKATEQPVDTQPTQEESTKVSEQPKLEPSPLQKFFEDPQYQILKGMHGFGKSYAVQKNLMDYFSTAKHQGKRIVPTQIENRITSDNKNYTVVDYGYLNENNDVTPAGKLPFCLDGSLSPRQLTELLNPISQKNTEETKSPAQTQPQPEENINPIPFSPELPHNININPEINPVKPDQSFGFTHTTQTATAPAQTINPLPVSTPTPVSESTTNPIQFGPELPTNTHINPEINLVDPNQPFSVANITQPATPPTQTINPLPTSTPTPAPEPTTNTTVPASQQTSENQQPQPISEIPKPIIETGVNPVPAPQPMPEDLRHPQTPTPQKSTKTTTPETNHVEPPQESPSAPQPTPNNLPPQDDTSWGTWAWNSASSIGNWVWKNSGYIGLASAVYRYFYPTVKKAEEKNPDTKNKTSNITSHIPTRLSLTSEKSIEAISKYCDQKNYSHGWEKGKENKVYHIDTPGELSIKVYPHKTSLEFDEKTTLPEDVQRALEINADIIKASLKALVTEYGHKMTEEERDLAKIVKVSGTPEKIKFLKDYFNKEGFKAYTEGEPIPVANAKNEPVKQENKEASKPDTSAPTSVIDWQKFWMTASAGETELSQKGMTNEKQIAEEKMKVYRNAFKVAGANFANEQIFEQIYYGYQMFIGKELGEAGKKENPPITSDAELKQKAQSLFPKIQHLLPAKMQELYETHTKQATPGLTNQTPAKR